MEHLTERTNCSSGLPFRGQQEVQSGGSREKAHFYKEGAFFVGRVCKSLMEDALRIYLVKSCLREGCTYKSGGTAGVTLGTFEHLLEKHGLKVNPYHHEEIMDKRMAGIHSDKTPHWWKSLESKIIQTLGSENDQTDLADTAKAETPAMACSPYKPQLTSTKDLSPIKLFSMWDSAFDL